MKKVFLFLASCLVAFAASAATYSVTIKDSQLSWSENDNGQMEARITLSSISSRLSSGDKITITYTGGNQKNSPYTVAIIDQSSAADYWYELSDWTDAIELNSSGNGSTTVTLTKSAMGSENIIAFFIYDLIKPEKTWDFQLEGLFYKIQKDGTVWVTHGSTKHTTSEASGHWDIYYYYYGDNAPEYENVIIPSGVSYNSVDYVVSGIDDYAFLSESWSLDGRETSHYYLNIRSITLPKTVTYIGTNAFNINSLYISDVESFCNVELNGNSYNEIYLNGKAIVDLVIPNSVETELDNRFKTPSLQTLTIGNGVYAISASAFEGCSKLNRVIIGENVVTIGDYAFAGCSSLSNITCYAVLPPNVNGTSTFSNYNGYLTIPCDNFEAYDIHSVWGTFKHVDCIGSETVELIKDEVVVEPEKTEAVFSMPKNESANSYTLTISNNGVTFCTLTFNAQGQLANIDFSTNKSYELKSGVEAFQFTVTGLSSAEDYGYSFKALASNKSVLKEYSGSFTTKNEDGTGGSVQGGGEGSDQGSQGGEGGEGGSTAVSEVSNTTAVSVVNGQILVNGEAPAFVVTVSGQKIANANLKAGVYFVVADGNSVKVVVR